MPLPGTAHVARIGLLFTFGTDGQQCENTFYVRDTTDAIFADPVGFCGHVQAAANSQIADGLAPQISLTGVSFEDVRTFPFGGVTVGISPHPGDGPETGVPLPSSNSIAIRKTTATLGRSGRGRWYWPLGNSSALGATNDTVNLAHITRYENALIAFQSVVEGAPFPCEMGIVSYRSGGVQRSAGLFSRITGWSTADALVDSQRRRLTGRGR